MKTVILAAGMAAALAGCASVPDASSASDAVAARVVALASAFERGDAEAVVAFVSPDMHLIHPQRGEVSAADFIAGVRQGVRPREGRTIRVALDRAFASGNLAVVNITWSTTLTAPDGAVTRRGERDQELWRRENGQWMLFRGASFPVDVRG